MIVSTQPSEPFPEQRFEAIRSTAWTPETLFYWFNQEIEQNPEAPDFWDMWRTIFFGYGFSAGDYIVASEPYGQRLADELGGVFMPYDMHRTVAPIKATNVRNDPAGRWEEMLPEFRKNLVQRVTIFGAESCGKTTLSKDLAEKWNAPWLFEWARPYLEAIGPEVTDEKMFAIHKGQLALQQAASHITYSPVIFQDTDLFSTVGYWRLYRGNGPVELTADAIWNKSDLYLIAPSNIPFEEDPLRYGDGQRESDDQFWIELCEQYGLNYKVLTYESREARVAEATAHITGLLVDNIYSPLHYERSFN